MLIEIDRLDPNQPLYDFCGLMVPSRSGTLPSRTFISVTGLAGDSEATARLLAATPFGYQLTRPIENHAAALSWRKLLRRDHRSHRKPSVAALGRTARGLGLTTSHSRVADDAAQRVLCRDKLIDSRLSGESGYGSHLLPLDLFPRTRACVLFEIATDPRGSAVDRGSSRTNSAEICTCLHGWN